LCNYAAKIIKEDGVVEDIVQNVFISIWESGKFDKIENYEGFLLRAVKYKCIDYLRLKKITSDIPLETISELTPPKTSSDIAEEDIEPLLHFFASKLPPKTREVFLLSRKSGMTYKEISVELDISVKTVENQMGRALRILRKVLKDYDILMLLLIP
jgi:RNA polymerase sigma-70 factor (ECF subfamily)